MCGVDEHDPIAPYDGALPHSDAGLSGENTRGDGKRLRWQGKSNSGDFPTQRFVALERDDVGSTRSMRFEFSKDPVVSTGAERSEAEWRDLLSMICRLLVEKGLSASRLRRSGRDDGVVWHRPKLILLYWTVVFHAHCHPERSEGPLIDGPKGPSLRSRAGLPRPR